MSLLGGGSGIVPLMAMVRAGNRSDSVTRSISSTRPAPPIMSCTATNCSAWRRRDRVHVSYAFTRAGLPC